MTKDEMVSLLLIGMELDASAREAIHKAFEAGRLRATAAPITKALGHDGSSAVPAWRDDGTMYPRGSRVQHRGRVFKALSGNNFEPGGRPPLRGAAWIQE